MAKQMQTFFPHYACVPRVIDAQAMDMCRKCLSMCRSESDAVVAEKQLVEAVTQLRSRFGVQRLPLQVRLAEPLEVLTWPFEVDRAAFCVALHGSASHSKPSEPPASAAALLELAALLGASHGVALCEVRALIAARAIDCAESLLAERGDSDSNFPPAQSSAVDPSHCFRVANAMCVALTQAGDAATEANAWHICARLAQCDSFRDVAGRRELCAYAITCTTDPTQLECLLGLWQRLDVLQQIRQATAAVGQSDVFGEDCAVGVDASESKLSLDGADASASDDLDQHRADAVGKLQHHIDSGLVCVKQQQRTCWPHAMRSNRCHEFYRRIGPGDGRPATEHTYEQRIASLAGPERSQADDQPQTAEKSAVSVSAALAWLQQLSLKSEMLTLAQQRWDEASCRTKVVATLLQLVEQTIQFDAPLTMVRGQRVVPMCCCCPNRAWRTGLFASNCNPRCLRIHTCGGTQSRLLGLSCLSQSSLSPLAVFSLCLRLCGSPVTTHLGLTHCSCVQAWFLAAAAEGGDECRAVLPQLRLQERLGIDSLVAAMASTADVDSIVLGGVKFEEQRWDTMLWVTKLGCRLYAIEAQARRVAYVRVAIVFREFVSPSIHAQGSCGYCGLMTTHGVSAGCDLAPGQRQLAR